jgi:hypothetical protein
MSSASSARQLDGRPPSNLVQCFPLPGDLYFQQVSKRKALELDTSLVLRGRSRASFSAPDVAQAPARTLSAVISA